MNTELSNKILKALSKFYGEVQPALDYKNIFELTVSVVLSAQTTDKQVNSVTPSLFQRYPDFAALSKARVADVEKIIKSTGFYKNKARHIISLSRRIVEVYNGTVPDTMEELITLDGVGRKSANIILSMGYGQPAIAVDTHVARIAQRLGYSSSKNPVTIERDLNTIIPKNKWSSINLLFIYHGRRICTARNPKCPDCPILDLCVFDDKNL